MIRETLIDRNEVTTATGDSYCHVVVNGVSKKIKKSNLQKDILTGYIGPLAIADTPTQDGYYMATETGTYTNAGSLVVDLADGVNYINVSATQTVFDLTIVTLSIEPVGAVEFGNLEAVSGGKVYDEMITKPTMSLGKNLYNPDTNTVGYYVADYNGTLLVDATRDSSDYIAVEASTTYIFNPNFIDNFAYYDSDRVYISGVSANTTVLTTPALTAYIRFSSFVATMNDAEAQFELGGVATTYEPYLNAIDVANLPSTIPTSKIPLLVDDLLGFDFAQMSIGKNLYNPATNNLDVYLNIVTGGLLVLVGQQTSDYIAVSPLTDYHINLSTTHICYYDDTFAFISGTSGAGISDVTTPALTAYVRFSRDDAFMEGDMQFEAGIYATYYEPYYFGFQPNQLPPDKIDFVTNIITVSVDGATDFVGRNSIQDAIDSITDATATVRYKIEVANGFYYVLNGSEYKGSPSYPAMITMRDYISIEGESQEGVIIHAELPYLDVDIDTAVSRDLHQTVWNFAQEANISNVTLVGKYIRYTIHQDSSQNANKKKKYENVTVKYEGDIGFLKAMGLGVYSGEETTLKNVKIDASTTTFTCHGNTNLDKETKYNLQNVSFNTQGYDTFTLENNGSIVKNRYDFQGCKMPLSIAYTENWLKANPASSQTYFNHAESVITGSGNTPFLFQNTVLGTSLLITNKTIGATGAVLFDETATAFDDLIKDPNVVVGAPTLSKLNHYINDGYYVLEGSTGTYSSAFGCVDLSEAAAASDSGVNYRSMGKRLGDCSTTSKALKIIINGTTYTVTFASDYTAVTNAVILAEIQAVITAVADASFYNYGKTYYPEMTDVVEVCKNGSGSVITKGSVVEVQDNSVTLANSWDENTGIALDDIPIVKAGSISATYGSGRILRKGLIYNSNSGVASHYVNVTGAVVEGSKMTVTAGVLVVDGVGDVEAIIYGLIKI